MAQAQLATVHACNGLTERQAHTGAAARGCRPGFGVGQARAAVADDDGHTPLLRPREDFHGPAFTTVLEGVVHEVVERSPQHRRVRPHPGHTARRHDVRDRGVRSAPFLVLVETEMPAILAEVASLSSPEEARLLAQAEYRDRLARALFDGIRAYSLATEQLAGR